MGMSSACLHCDMNSVTQAAHPFDNEGQHIRQQRQRKVARAHHVEAKSTTSRLMCSLDIKTLE